MVGDQKVVLFVVYRAQMIYKTVPESTLSLTGVEEATSGSADTIDLVDGCAGKEQRDLIEMYKTMRGIDRVDGKKLVPLVEGSMTRGIDI
eukprot:g34256.t1